MRKDEIQTVLLDCLQEVCEQDGKLVDHTLDDSSHLIGFPSVLDSLGLVRFVIAVEQKLELDYQISITLADDRAMSQTDSPFLTVGTLRDYIWFLANENKSQIGYTAPPSKR